jgi:tetratricopeptide (TPR) repeat protein
MFLLSQNPQFQHSIEDPIVIRSIQNMRKTLIVPDSPPIIRDLILFSFSQIESIDGFYTDQEIRTSPPLPIFPDRRSTFTSPPTEIANASIEIATKSGIARVKGLLARGEAFARIGAIPAALADFEAAHRLDPTLLRPLLSAGLAQLTMKRFMDACDTFVRALEVDSKNEAAIDGFKEVLRAVKTVRLPQVKWEITRLKLTHTKSAGSRALRSLFEENDGGSKLEGSLADKEFREVLRELMDNGLLS